MEKAYQEYIEEWRRGYGSGSESCAYIAEAFARCPDLLSIRAYRDVENDQVDISAVWATGPETRSSDADRAASIKDLQRAGLTLTQCHEFTLYALAARPEGNPLENQASIAIGLKLPQAQAYLEAMDLRSSLSTLSPVDPAMNLSKPRL